MTSSSGLREGKDKTEDENREKMILQWYHEKNNNNKNKKTQTRMTDSILKLDPNTYTVKKKANLI